MKRFQRGITLIEALISLVILVMGISTVLIVVLKSSHTARELQNKSDAEQVASNIVEGYWAKGSIVLPQKFNSKYALSVSEANNCKTITVTSKTDDLIQIKRRVTDQCLLKSKYE